MPKLWPGKEDLAFSSKENLFRVFWTIRGTSPSVNFLNAEDCPLTVFVDFKFEHCVNDDAKGTDNNAKVTQRRNPSNIGPKLRPVSV